MYPIFYAAFHPTLAMPERWASGTLNQTTWQLWQLFEERGALITSQARQALGVNCKQVARAVDTALQQLQRGAPGVGEETGLAVKHRLSLHHLICCARKQAA
jgi:hypothetical protein